MAIDIKVPEIGESITEGVLVRWLKEEGEQIHEGDPLFELETDKATTEVPAPGDGVLKIQTEEGATVEIGQTVGALEEGKGEVKEKKDTGKQQKEKKPKKERKPEKDTTSESKPKEERKEGEEDDNAVASPAARELIREHHLDLQQITGNGHQGRITREDVERYLKEREKSTKEKKPDKAPAPTSGHEREETREPMSAIRQRIAERLVRSQQTTATLTTFNEVDLSEVLKIRKQHREAFAKKHDTDLGLMSFFVKAVVSALRELPIVNARIDRNEITHPNQIHVGVAVSTENGLMVPVVRDADLKSFAQIEKDINAFAEKAREGKIRPEDLQQGTFTITNGGVFGSMLSTPILNPPQSGILGMHAIEKRPVVRDDEIVIRPMMYLALTYDHRLIDGREAVLFLRHVKEQIEDPTRLLLDL